MITTTNVRIAKRIIARIENLFERGSDAYNVAIDRNINKFLAFEPRKDALASRVELASTIREHAESGKIAIVWGFRDCDMAQSDGIVTLLPACVAAVNRFWEEQYADAEGPVWGHIEKPSIAEGVKSESRDLALEAFEDGHPHICYV